MGAIVLTGAAARPHRDHYGGLPVTNEPRILVHWDGVANRKQNSNLANGVVWVNPQSLIRYGMVNMGLQFHLMNAGASTVKIEGSMTPGIVADRLKDSDVWSANQITAENSNFAQISAALANGTSVNTTIIYTLLRITFSAVGTAASLSITSM